MISVKEAERIVLDNTIPYPSVKIPLDIAVGRVLREKIIADHDFPPFHRVMMDGIAINHEDYAQGIRRFSLQETQGAGDRPVMLKKMGNCIEIMTGAVLPAGTDTVVPYEDLQMDVERGFAILDAQEVIKGKNVHTKGADRKAGDVLVEPGMMMLGPEIGLAASVGMTELSVTKNPRVTIISSGNELVDIDQKPEPHQIRKSNTYAIQAELMRWGIRSDMMHLRDDRAAMEQSLVKALNDCDILILSGGVSKGKYDYIPEVLESLGVLRLFHRIKQKPGKPFWFGRKGNTPVFAFPGNPVSTFMCFHRFLIPWLRESMGIRDSRRSYARLAEDVQIKGNLTYFLQVEVTVTHEGHLRATPFKGSGSGDHANLNNANAFMELPAGKLSFKKGESHPIFLFRSIN